MAIFQNMKKRHQEDEYWCMRTAQFASIRSKNAWKWKDQAWVKKAFLMGLRTIWQSHNGVLEALPPVVFVLVQCASVQRVWCNACTVGSQPRNEGKPKLVFSFPPPGNISM